jgi:fibronectin type 3 domain-containing protein
VTPGGLFTAPGVGVNITVTIQATSIADVSKSANATVTVLPHVIQRSVNLNWNASTSTNIVGYNVYRAQAPGGPYSKINTGGLVASTLYTDTGVTSSITYYYVTTVVDNRGRESARSNQVQVAIP